MKEITIKIGIDEEHNKVGTMLSTKGFSKDNISNQLELLGIFENLCDLQKDKLKVMFQGTQPSTF